MVLGLLDEPEVQRQTVASFRPVRDGHLLITGEQGTGKSTALEGVASQCPSHLWLDRFDSDGAWDALQHVGDDTLVFIDDVESLSAEFSLEHREQFLDVLTTLLRTGPSRGVYFVVSANIGSPLAPSWASLLKTTLVLGASSNGFPGAGRGSSLGFSGSFSSLSGRRSPASQLLQPGRGIWREHAIQIAQSEQSVVHASRLAGAGRVPIRSMAWERGQTYAVVSSRPRSFGTGLPEGLDLIDIGITEPAVAGIDAASVGTTEIVVIDAARPRVYIGDVEDWQSQWALLAQIRSRASYVFDGCTPAEVRAVRRSRQLLPPARAGVGILVDPEGKATRVILKKENPQSVPSAGL
jgi:S-DNA-T family DNA segregation ATPase FtsK/SpoIIIE